MHVFLLFFKQLEFSIKKTMLKNEKLFSMKYVSKMFFKKSKTYTFLTTNEYILRKAMGSPLAAARLGYRSL